jgi:hypothetical protein
MDNAEPTLPIEANDPMLPIDSTEPLEPIDKTLSCDQRDQRAGPAGCGEQRGVAERLIPAGSQRPWRLGICRSEQQVWCADR